MSTTTTGYDSKDYTKLKDTINWIENMKRGSVDITDNTIQKHLDSLNRVKNWFIVYLKVTHQKWEDLPI